MAALRHVGAVWPPGQERYWIEVSLFGAPYDADDAGLEVALEMLKERLVVPL